MMTSEQYQDDYDAMTDQEKAECDALPENQRASFVEKKATEREARAERRDKVIGGLWTSIPYIGIFAVSAMLTIISSRVFPETFCKWGIGDVCESTELPPCEDDECNDVDPATITITDVPGELETYWNQFEGTESRPTEFGQPCEQTAGTLFQCIRVFYATPRVQQYNAKGQLEYTKELADQNYVGMGEVSVPLPCVDLNAEECIVKRNFFDFSDENITEEDIDRTRPLTDLERRQKVEVKIRNLERNDSEDEVTQIKSDLIKGIERSDGRVFLYIHGFNQTFDAAMQTAALMTSDLNFNPEKPLDSLNPEIAKFPLGYPVIYSWPNRENPYAYLCDKGVFDLNGEGNEEIISAFVLKHSRKFRRVNPYMAGGAAAVAGMCAGADPDTNVISASPFFAQFFNELINLTSAPEAAYPIREVNIFVHSMGNRLLLNALEDMANAYLETNNRDLKIRIVHAAADLNHSEYREAMGVALELKSATNPNRRFKPEITIYASESDTPLNAARDIGTLRQTCRIGLIIPNVCPPFTTNKPKNWSGTDYNVQAEVVDASGFVLQTGIENRRFIFWDLPPKHDRGHGYALNAAFFVSDVRCTFKGWSASSHKRALQEFPNSSPNHFRPHLGKFLFENECAQFDLIKSETKPCKPVMNKTVLFSDFELKETVIPNKHLKSIELVSECIGIGKVAKVMVRGYADTSGEATLNKSVSTKRAINVANKLKSFAPSNVIFSTIGMGEVSADENLADNKSDGVRDKNNRRVEVDVVLN